MKQNISIYIYAYFFDFQATFVFSPEELVKNNLSLKTKKQLGILRLSEESSFSTQNQRASFGHMTFQICFDWISLIL